MTRTAKITKDFYLHEFTDSATAARLGIDNSIPEALWPNFLRLAKLAQQIRDYLGVPVLISSGFRCEALNAAIPGSSRTSRHMLALAIDIKGAGLTPKQVAERLKLRIDEFEIDQLILEYNQWTHAGLALDGEKPRREVFSYVRGQKGVEKHNGLVV